MPGKFNVGPCPLQCYFPAKHRLSEMIPLSVHISGGVLRLQGQAVHLQFVAVLLHCQVNEVLSFPEQQSRMDLRGVSALVMLLRKQSKTGMNFTKILTNKGKAVEIQISCSPDTGKRYNNKIPAQKI